MAASAARASTSSFGKQVESYLAQSAKPKPLHLVYQTSPSWPFGEKTRGEKQQVDVGVLDSSFNPPQLAHYALASSAKPALCDEESSSSSSGSSNARPTRGAASSSKPHYDALLLLYSVKNADKGMGTSKDATAAQRLGMMQCLAHDLEADFGANVAVGIVEQPLMIDKSTLVHDYVRQVRAAREQDAGNVRLHWLVGFDTLERFFQVKYYPSPQFFAKACETFFAEEKTTFICARRGAESLPNKEQAESMSQTDEEQALLDSDEVKPWHERGSIVLMDLDPNVGGNSSTAIRKLVQRSHDKDEAELEADLGKMTTSTVAQFIVQEKLYRE